MGGPVEVPAGEAVQLRFLSKGTDWERSPTYPAEYLHQVFDDEPEETIRGHVNPRVDLFFAAGSLRPFIMFESDSKQHSTATDVVGKLKEWYPEGVATRDLDSYLRAVDSDAESWTPPGEQVGEFAAPSGESGETYLVYKVEGEAALADARPFHDRAQVLSVFYIDGARLLDVDPRWEIFYLVRRTVSNGEKSLATVGYCTTYAFYHHPDKIRFRISQFIIFPPYQRQRLGAKFYDSIMSLLRSRPDVIDVTVEDPADVFQALRDACDYRALASNASLSAAVAKSPKEAVERVCRELKLSKRQAVRVGEIAALKGISAGDKARVREYRLAVKQRLLKENEDELDVVKKQSAEEYYEKLQGLFEDTLEKYRVALSSSV